MRGRQWESVLVQKTTYFIHIHHFMLIATKLWFFAEFIGSRSGWHYVELDFWCCEHNSNHLLVVDATRKFLAPKTRVHLHVVSLHAISGVQTVVTFCSVLKVQSEPRIIVTKLPVVRCLIGIMAHPSNSSTSVPSNSDLGKRTALSSRFM